MERRSGFKIMKRLILELKPLLPVMFITVTFGVLGFLAAISITSFGAVAIGDFIGSSLGVAMKTAILLMILFAVIRGPLRYVEQLSGHYIAFKILVILRDKIFTALRKLAPAKLEKMGKGNLVSLVTADIELLEVFYAHTIAPISIAIITNTIITIVLFVINPVLGIMGGVYFFIVGFCIPYFTSIYGKKAGEEYRKTFGETNTYLLDSLRGLKEVLIYKADGERRDEINRNSKELNLKQKKIKTHEGMIRAFSDSVIMIAILSFVFVGGDFVIKGTLAMDRYILAIFILASSFGPVVALSNLSNNLLQTFAAADRLFNLLDEEPEVNDVLGNEELQNVDVEYNNVNFGYKGREEILKDINLKIKKGDKVAIIGESGSGKSTLVKLLMRFFYVNNGEITIGKKNVKDISTYGLRKAEVLMSQETYLFNETIEENIKLAKMDATREEVIEAAKKASIHEFIETLPNGYETKAGELGGNFSSGEKQRIGLARAFLRDGDIMILDEPTSNLDTLNEGSILKSIRENCGDKTIILITHRNSTTSICSRTLKLENKRLEEIS
ncbi:thiol reductant ABC exporter subunit CydC [Clostridium paraputrificum]|uniref:thiol reductant ABC exporter subunit CydC n=1 Tax=Clostridium paraputrificum TaxID=29363 RepID=UPI003D324856